MTDLLREWERILESHGLPADRGDTVLDQTTYLGNPRAYTDEKSEYSTLIDGLRAEPKAWWLEPGRPVVPIRIITPEELRALDPGGSALSYFVDLRTKYRFNAYSSELQAARFRGRHHSEETRRRIGEANRKTYWAKTPEERAKSLANRVYKKCEQGCTCAKHDPEVCTKRARSYAAGSTTCRSRDYGVRMWRGAGAPRGRCSFRCRCPSFLRRCQAIW